MTTELLKEATIILDSNLRKIGHSVKESQSEEHTTMINTLLSAMTQFAAYACELQKIECYEASEVQINPTDTLTSYSVVENSILNSRNIIKL